MTDLYAVHVGQIWETSNGKRVQTSILATQERRLLNWICAKIPQRIKPDHMTLLGALGALMVFLGYVMSHVSVDFLSIAIAGYVLNWLGDSVDGSLARYRHVERRRYGYFLDHSVDAVSIFLILVGVGLSGYVRLDVAMLTLIGYFLMCIHVFLAKPVTGRFQLTFLYMGPTELRLGLIVLTLSMAVGAGNIEIYGVSIIDGALIVTTAMMFLLFFFRTAAVLRELESIDGETLANQFVSNSPDDAYFWQAITGPQRLSKNRSISSM